MQGNTVSLGNAVNNLFALFGASSGSSLATLERFAAHIWLAVVVLGYLVSLAGFVLIVYILMRLFDLRKREEEHYETLIGAPERRAAGSPRFERIRELGGSANASEWREAIIEADVMLDEALSARGYVGDLAEKLRQAPLATLHDAQEAHGVRNRVAHQGSAFDLSPVLVSRTLARYEAALRELGAL